MSKSCQYCHEPITRHEDVSEVMDDDGSSRIYHGHCHDRDIYEHREWGERLPEDQPGPPLTFLRWKVMANGRRTVRTVRCPCGSSFETKELTARYHSNECRKTFGRFGQTHGQVAPRQFGTYKPGGVL